VRLFGIRPRNTTTVSVHVSGGTSAASIRKDAAAFAIAGTKACKRPTGLVASVLGERGPSSAVVVTRSDTGETRRITVDCGTGNIIKRG